MNMKKNILILIVFLFICGIVFLIFIAGAERKFVYYAKPKMVFWNFRSVDTMKYSRDLSREKMNNKDFDAVIDLQIKNIAAIGSTHVAIATPYDEEFLPMLRRWVKAARKYDLKVWFRGNLSGWEGWFEYPKISREEHIKKTEEFILANPDIFSDGDIFSSCPECENGGSGDPRSFGDIGEYRKFIIEEYQTTEKAFKLIKKDVASNYFSMNADVARLIMDKKTTAALGGIVAIDHYVKDPAILAKDVKEIAKKSGGKIVLGEFGAPIPDIHGEMTEIEQSEWIRDALNDLISLDTVEGVNYWVNVGGSTQIWSSRGIALPAAGILGDFYKPNAAYGVIRDELARPIDNARIGYSNGAVFSNKDGYFELSYASSKDSALKISAAGFLEQEIFLEQNEGQLDIMLKKEKKDTIFKLLEFIQDTRHYLFARINFIDTML